MSQTRSKIGLTIPETVICLSKVNWSKVAIPVTNDSNCNSTLTPRTILGHVQQVKSIYQAVRPACTNKNTTDTSSTVEKTDSKACRVESQKEDQSQQDIQKYELWDPPVSIDHLLPGQQQKVKKMLREECNAFSKDENDVGCIPSLQLKIRLSDTKHLHLSSKTAAQRGEGLSGGPAEWRMD